MLENNARTPKISICIPTFNRSKNLNDCIDSILLNNGIDQINYEVCISDNCSVDSTEEFVSNKIGKLPLKYFRHKAHVSRVENYKKVISLASGDFVWLIGDDDLLLPDAIYSINELIIQNNEVEFFYINSYCINSNYFDNGDLEYKLNNIDPNTKRFSSWRKDGEMNFLGLINPKISFDFLGGMFLAVFKKEKWDQNVHLLSEDLTNDLREFSHFENTFPHIKIFANSFSNSKAYFSANPLSINLFGIREWSSFSPLINSVRLIEALGEYRKNGLPLFKYLIYKNFALNNFLPDLVKIRFYSGNTGREYIKFRSLIFSNFLYPNFYLSIFYFLFKKIFK